MTMEEIADIMEFKLETINKARLELFKIFEVSSLIDLCKKAIEYGYAKDLIENLDRLRKSHEFGSLGVWELIYLHQYIKGHSESEILRMASLEDDHLKRTRESLYKKLTIENDYQVLFKAIVAGYIRCVPVPIESIPKTEFYEKYEEWRKTQAILKIPQFQLKEASRLWHIEE